MRACSGSENWSVSQVFDILSGFSNLAYAPAAFAISRIQRAMES